MPFFSLNVRAKPTDDNHIIPGMGPEDKIDFGDSGMSGSGPSTADDRGGSIPGLDLDSGGFGKDRNNDRDKKVPYSKPIPRNFQAQWNDTGRPDDDDGVGCGPMGGPDGAGAGPQFDGGMPDMSVQPPNIGGMPPPMQQPSAIIVYGKTIPVQRT